MNFTNTKSRFRAPLLAVGVAAMLCENAAAHAQDRRSASAQFHIQITVIPALVAAQSTRPQVVQPSLSPITFGLQSTTRNPATYSVREFAPNAQSGKPQAVLQTMTMVPE